MPEKSRYLMTIQCKNETDAIKAVMDKFYSGQQKLFEKVLAHSAQELFDCWMITVYLSNIFRETSVTTYRVDKKKGITKNTPWIRGYGQP